MCKALLLDIIVPIKPFYSTNEGTTNMTYVTREDHIDILEFPGRIYNALRRAGIHTVGQLLDFPLEDLRSFSNLGAKTAEEIALRVTQLRDGSGPFEVVEYVAPAAPEQENEEIQESVSESFQHTYLDQLGLSVRATNCLKKIDVITAADLSRCSEDELRGNKGMGAKTLAEILEKRRELLAQLDAGLTASVAHGDGEGSALDSFVRAFSEFTAIPRGELIREIFSSSDVSNETFDAADLCRKLYERDAVYRCVKNAVLRLIEAHDDGIDCQAIAMAMPEGTSTDAVDDFLQALRQENLLIEEGDLIKRRYPSALEFVQNLPDSNGKKMLLMRLQGETLMDIGLQYDITRERVRQLILKEIAARSRVYEDKYLDLFNRYDFSFEDFELAFGETKESYYYLKIVQAKGQRKPIAEIVDDDTVPEQLRHRAERAIFRDYVTIDGTRVKKDSHALTRFVLKRYCKDLTTMDEFAARYLETLASLDLVDDPKLQIELRTYENKLAASEDVLWNRNHSFRYYPISQFDYTPMLEDMDLDAWEDMDFSSLMLFRDYPEYMKDYDIRDEYELHNLLKKIWPAGEDQRVQFKRMPTIIIGDPNRDQQILDFMMQFAPITSVELAEKYEEKYGVRWDTAMGTHFNCLSDYLHSGVYRVDFPALPEDQHAHLSQILTKDFYRFEEVRRIYQQEYPASDPSYINAYSVRLLGFDSYSGYIVAKRHGGAAIYFRNLLLSGDVVDMRPYRRDFSSIVAYGSELYKLRETREIIEYAPYQYVNMKHLNSQGISLNDLNAYCTAVFDAVSEGEYFTIKSLRQNGFKHQLDSYGFDEWFYASVLIEDREHFSYHRLGHTRLFHRGQETVYLNDFLRWLLLPVGKMDCARLHGLLETQFGITIVFDKLVEQIRSSDLYYDAAARVVYIDYETYVETWQ